MNYGLIVLGAGIGIYATYHKFESYYSDDTIYDFSERRSMTIHGIQAAIAMLFILYGSVLLDVSNNYCQVKGWKSNILTATSALALVVGVYLLFNIYWVRRKGHKTNTEKEYAAKQHRRKSVLDEHPDLAAAVIHAAEEKSIAEFDKETQAFEEQLKWDRLAEQLDSYRGDTAAQRDRRERLLIRYSDGSRSKNLERSIEKLVATGGVSSLGGSGGSDFTFMRGRGGKRYRRSPSPDSLY